MKPIDILKISVEPPIRLAKAMSRHYITTIALLVIFVILPLIALYVRSPELIAFRESSTWKVIKTLLTGVAALTGTLLLLGYVISIRNVYKERFPKEAAAPLPNSPSPTPQEELVQPTASPVLTPQPELQRSNAYDQPATQTKQVEQPYTTPKEPEITVSPVTTPQPEPQRSNAYNQPTTKHVEKPYIAPRKEEDTIEVDVSTLIPSREFRLPNPNKGAGSPSISWFDSIPQPTPLSRHSGN